MDLSVHDKNIKEKIILIITLIIRESVALSEGETFTYIRRTFYSLCAFYFGFCVPLDVSLIASRGGLMTGIDVIRF